MLHDRHQLHGVITQSFDARQNPVCKFTVGTNTVFLGRHTDMCLIDKRDRVGNEAAVGPGPRLRRIPDFTDPVKADLVLYHTACVKRNMVAEAVAVLHHGPDPASVMQRIFRKLQLPVPVFQAGHGICCFIPAVKITHQEQRIGCGRPLPVNPALAGVMKAIVLMRIGKVAQFSGTRKLCAYPQVVFLPLFQILPERHECLVIIQNTQHFRRSSRLSLML